MHEMEQALEDPTKLDRIRFLSGADPTPAELQGNLEEVRVASEHWPDWLA